MTMNIKQVAVSAILSLCAASAFAQSTEFVAPDAGFKSMKSRADVMAEVKAANIGSMPGAKDGVYPVITNRSTMSREQRHSAESPSANRAGDASSLYFG
jgi:hypothetical protein